MICPNHPNSGGWEKSYKLFPTTPTCNSSVGVVGNNPPSDVA